MSAPRFHKLFHFVRQRFSKRGTSVYTYLSAREIFFPSPNESYTHSARVHETFARAHDPVLYIYTLVSACIHKCTFSCRGSFDINHSFTKLLCVCIMKRIFNVVLSSKKAYVDLRWIYVYGFKWSLRNLGGIVISNSDVCN